MSATEYRLAGPLDSRFEGVKLRLLAYRPRDWKGTEVKAVVQVIGDEVIGEDPLAEEWMPLTRFESYVFDAISDGWRLM